MLLIRPSGASQLRERKIFLTITGSELRILRKKFQSLNQYIKAEFIIMSFVSVILFFFFTRDQQLAVMTSQLRERKFSLNFVGSELLRMNFQFLSH